MRQLALGPLVAALLFAFAPPDAEARVQFKLEGRWTCKDVAVKPLQGARIELWRSRTAWRDQKVTTRYTDADGRYSIPVNAEDHFDLYVKVLLNDDDGVKLENWYSPFTWETTTSTRRSRSGTVNLGTWQIAKDGSGTPKCAIWQGVHDAYADYRQVIGRRPPSPSLKVEAEFPCCGTPFATGDTIRWPGGYGVDGGATPKHEFAHTVRHTLDGDFLHFTADAANFQYPQFHSSCKVTNAGFAFNEGWASYWARKFNGACSTTQDFNREGDVAAALTRLEACSNRRTMVEVLRRNPRTLHSFRLFETRWSELTGSAGCAVPLVQQPSPPEPTPTPAQQIANLQAQVAAQRRLVASLKRRAAAAKRRARGTSNPTRLVEPSLLAAQTEQAQLVLDRMEAGLAAARKANFDPGRQLVLADSLLKDEGGFQLRNRKIMEAGLEKGLDRIKSEKGARRTGLFKTLDERADGLGRARKRGPAKVDDLYAAPPTAGDAVKKVR